MMEFTATTLVLLASIAHIAFAQPPLDELLLNACQVYYNPSLSDEFLSYTIARHSIFEDVNDGQQ